MVQIFHVLIFILEGCRRKILTVNFFPNYSSYIVFTMISASHDTQQYSTIFSPYSANYKVCGKTRGCQRDMTDAFSNVDGVSITLGNPRKHVRVDL